MKFKSSKVTNIKVSDIEGMDPIDITIDDQGAGKGRITFSCEGKTYSSFWPAMGTDISRFVVRIDDDYLRSNVGGPSANVDDIEAFKKYLMDLISEIKEEEELNAVEIGECIHAVMLNETVESIGHSLSNSFYAAAGMRGPWDLEVPRMPNYKYKRFTEIAAIVRKALKWNLDQNGGDA